MSESKEAAAKKSYGSVYATFNITQGLSDIDPVTLSTPAQPTVDDSEEIKKLLEKGDMTMIDQTNTYVMRSGQRGFQPYEIDTAYNYYCIGNHVNMITKEVIPTVQKQRIIIYKNFKDKFADYKYEESKIEKLFLKFLNTLGACTDDEILELKRFLVFDTSDSVCSNLGTKTMTIDDRLVFRNISTNALNKTPVGTWIIRPSSITDSKSNNIYVRVLSINTGSSITNVPIIHVWGYGYLVTIDIDRGTNLDDYNFKDARGEWFPSLLDVLLYFTRSLSLNLSKYYKVPRSAYSFAKIEE